MTTGKHLTKPTAPEAGHRNLTAARSLPAWAARAFGGINVAIPRQKVQAAARTIDEALTPATPGEFAGALDGLFDYARAFGLAVGDAELAAHFYHGALGELPAWAIQRAVGRTTGSWKWGNRMPLPADVRENTPEEYHDLKLARTRLNQHLATGHFFGDAIG